MICGSHKAFGCTYVLYMERSVKAAVGELDDVGKVFVEWEVGADWTPADGQSSPAA